MTANSETTSFRQFNTCSLCKISHKQGKKHVYSKRHQIILHRILEKFSNKIQTSRKDLFSPVVQGGTFEAGAKFWCSFCKEEYDKHELIENYIIVGAGVLGHIADKNHRSNMEQFFWDNLLKKELKTQFILSMEDLCIFKKAAMLAVKKRQKVEEVARKKVAEKIRDMDEKRWSDSTIRMTSQACLPGNVTTSPGSKQQNRNLCDKNDWKLSSNNMNQFSSAINQFSSAINQSSSARNQSSSAINQSSSARNQSSSGRNQSSSGRKKTLSAKADGLICIIKDSGEEDGNVHTGALPPWLQPDAVGADSMQIGPTMDEFQRHLEREKKAKLPANRIGAKFDHTASTSYDWLPSFGRVWSKGRRLQSQQHFEREYKTGFGKYKQKQGSARSSYSEHSTQTSGVNKRQLTSTASAYSASSTSESSHTSAYQDFRDNTSDLTEKCQKSNQIAPYKRKLVSADGTCDSPSNTHGMSVHQNEPYSDIGHSTSTTCDPYKSNATCSPIGEISASHMPSDSEMTNHCVPYKRKHNVPYSEVTNRSAPYKRRRDQTSNKTDDEIKLIHTPILALDRIKK